MFIAGRIDRQKKLKRVREDITDIINKCATEAVKTLADGNRLEILHKYQKIQDDNRKLQSTYDQLLLSHFPCGKPDVAYTVNIQKSKETISSENEKDDTMIADLNWHYIRDGILQKYQKENEQRKKTYTDYQKNIQQYLIAELYMPEDSIDAQKHSLLFLAGKYCALCNELFQEAQDYIMQIEHEYKQFNSFPLFTPNTWVSDFINLVELPQFITNEERAIRYRNNEQGMLENILYLSVKGKNINEQMHTIESDEVAYRTFALDLPYHMCRFLSLFGSLTFEADIPYRKQFPSIERFTDTELLVHFALKNSDDLFYKQFLLACDKEAFFKCNISIITRALNNAVGLLINSFPNKLGNKTEFSTNVHGNVILYKCDKIKNNQNNIYPPDTEQRVIRQKEEIPADIMKVLRSFILPYIEEYQTDYEKMMFDCKQSEFEEKYAERILSPIGKLLNFDIQANIDFAKLNQSRSNILINRCLQPTISTMYCVTEVYTILLQAAYAIREISDPVNLQEFDCSFLLPNIIVCGTEFNHPQILSYISIFEAFPGLFYYTFLAANMIKKYFDRNAVERNDADENKIIALFKKYTTIITRLKLKNDITSLTKFIKPDNYRVRHISVENIVSIYKTCKKDIQEIRNILLDKKVNAISSPIGIPSEHEKKAYFMLPLLDEKAFQASCKIQLSWCASSLCQAYRAFYSCPILFQREIITIHGKTK